MLVDMRTYWAARFTGSRPGVGARRSTRGGPRNRGGFEPPPTSGPDETVIYCRPLEQPDAIHGGARCLSPKRAKYCIKRAISCPRDQRGTYVKMIAASLSEVLAAPGPERRASHRVDAIVGCCVQLRLCPCGPRCSCRTTSSHCIAGSSPPPNRPKWSPSVARQSG